jgi:hypothetical protein
MSVTLDLSFSGLCMVVRRRDAGVVSVLVLDARKAGKALDGKGMRAHSPALVNRADGSVLTLPRTLALGAGGPDFDSVPLCRFVPLHQVVPGHPVHEDHLKDNAKSVVSRIDLRGGRMLPSQRGALWSLEPMVDGETHLPGGWFAWTATWRIEDVSAQDLAALGIQSPGSGTLELELRNLPPGHGGGHSDHGHGHGDGHGHLTAPGKPDDDFRWFYQVVGEPKGLQGKLRNEGLPIPVLRWMAPPDPHAESQSKKKKILEPDTHTCVGGWGEP